MTNFLGFVSRGWSKNLLFWWVITCGLYTVEPLRWMASSFPHSLILSEFLLMVMYLKILCCRQKYHSGFIIHHNHVLFYDDPWKKIIFPFTFSFIVQKTWLIETGSKGSCNLLGCCDSLFVGQGPPWLHDLAPGDATAVQSFFIVTCGLILPAAFAISWCEFK